jgi:transposase
MKGKREQLIEALQGTLNEHHHFLLSSQLRQVDFLASQVQELDQEIARRLGLSTDSDEHESAEPEDALVAKEENLRPPEHPEGTFPPSAQPPAQALSPSQAIRMLDEVPGINVRVGSIIVAELGLQMDRFPDDAHLASWVGLCPAAKISANKRLSTKIGKGNQWLRQALIEVAHAAARSKGTFLEAYYQRLRRRMGHKKAIVALAHRILVIIYYLLKEGQPYRELGPEHAEAKAHEASKTRAVRRLEQLGYQVTLQTEEVA